MTHSLSARALFLRKSVVPYLPLPFPASVPRFHPNVIPIFMTSFARYIPFVSDPVVLLHFLLVFPPSHLSASPSTFPLILPPCPPCPLHPLHPHPSLVCSSDSYLPVRPFPVIIPLSLSSVNLHPIPVPPTTALCRAPTHQWEGIIGWVIYKEQKHLPKSDIVSYALNLFVYSRG